MNYELELTSFASLDGKYHRVTIIRGFQPWMKTALAGLTCHESTNGLLLMVFAKDDTVANRLDAYLSRSLFSFWNPETGRLESITHLNDKGQWEEREP